MIPFGFRRVDLSPTDGSAEVARSQAEKTALSVEGLKRDVERLFMVAEAIWTFLKEQHDYTDDDLARRIREIDLRDGRLDGQVAREGPRLCPHCQRPLDKTRDYCIYCGQLIQRGPFDH